jgi:hypothetical protein
MFLRYERDRLAFQNELTVTYNQAGNSPYGTFSRYTELNPYWTPYDGEGNLKKILESRVSPARINVGNPLHDALLPYRNDSHYEQVKNNFAVDWRISQALQVKGRLSLTRQTGRSDVYVSAKDSRFETEEYSGENFSRRGKYVYGTNYMFRYETDVTANYRKILRDRHVIHASLNYRLAETRQESHSVTGEGYTAANMHLFGVANGYEKDAKPTSRESISRSLGGLANVNYTYDDRYFADASVKMDASSQFGANRRSAPFWSVGAGWNLHHEEFISRERVSSLRLRASYGISGSQKFNPYQAMTVFHYRERNYRYWNGYYMIALGNEDLRWETTGQLNVGTDGELFDKRVRFRLDFYNKDTYDLLADMNTPLSSGFYNYKANIGKVRNRGIEMALSVYLWRNARERISWSVEGTLVHNKNTVLKISDALEALNQQISEKDEYVPSFLVKEGESLNTIFAVKSLGIDPSNGAEVLVKKDGTKVFGSAWSAADKVPCGVSDPKARGTLRTTFRRKNLSCTMVFNYRLGADVYNQTLVDKVENVNPMWNADKRAFYDRWKQPGDRVKFKGVAYYQLDTRASSRFVMREYMLDCSSINLSYDLSSDWLRHAAGLDRLTVNAYTEDVFRLSTIKRERGTSYPFARRFSLSLSALF